MGSCVGGVVTGVIVGLSLGLGLVSRIVGALLGEMANGSALGSCVGDVLDGTKVGLILTEGEQLGTTDDGLQERLADGVDEGVKVRDGTELGDLVGYEVVGIADGVMVRTGVGRLLGRQLGGPVGAHDGVAIGILVGTLVDGRPVGEGLGYKGAKDTVGITVGDFVGS